MDSEKKRRPISAQVQRLVLSIAVGALLLSGYIAYCVYSFLAG